MEKEDKKKLVKKDKDRLERGCPPSPGLNIYAHAPPCFLLASPVYIFEMFFLSSSVYQKYVESSK